MSKRTSSAPALGSAFRRLRGGHIVGVVTSQGVVCSEFTGRDIRGHGEFWNVTHCQWRWSHDRSIWWTVQERKPNAEQFDAIRSHLTRKFGLTWWENGHYDIHDLQAKIEREIAREQQQQNTALNSSPTK